MTTHQKLLAMHVANASPVRRLYVQSPSSELPITIILMLAALAVGFIGGIQW